MASCLTGPLPLEKTLTARVSGELIYPKTWPFRNEICFPK